MRSEHPTVPLSRVAFVDICDVVHSGAPVALTGVLNRGRGVIIRPEVEAKTTSYVSLHRLSAGQVVYSKLKAFEGSIAVVPQEADGLFASPEFPTLSLRDDVLSEYLEVLFQYPPLWEALAAGSKGMGGRRERLSPGDLLKVQIPLPSVKIQRRIVDLLSAADRVVGTAETELEAAEVARTQIIDHVTASAVASPTHLSELLASRKTGYWGIDAPKDSRSVEVRVIRNGDLTDSGELLGAATRWFTSRESEKSSIELHDVVLTTSGSVGKAWLASSAGYNASNFVRVLTADTARVLPEFLYMILRSSHLRYQMAIHTGGSVLKNLHSSFWTEATVLLPSLAVQQQAVDSHKRATALVVSVSERLRLARYLRDQLLHDLLSGAHTIPESYDRFLAEAAP